MKKIYIPAGVKEIGDYAFSDASVEKVILPNSLIKISESAFNYCQNLKEIEQLSGSLFEKYEGFSIQSYEFSKIIKAYLSQKQYID